MAKVVKLHGQKAKPKFKYTLNDELQKLPRATTINDIVLHLAKFSVSRDEFYADRNIEYGSKKSIPDDRMQVYAKVFDCPVEDLRNQEVKATSIRQQKSKSKLKTPLS